MPATATAMLNALRPMLLPLLAFIAISTLLHAGMLTWPTAALLVLLGLCAGLLAGLFGLGGGTVVVPGLIAMFEMMDVAPEVRMHMALGTSLAVIIPSSLAAARMQARRGGVDKAWRRALMPGIASGALLGAAVAHFLPSHGLMLIFSLFLFYVGARSLFSSRGAVVARPRPTPHRVTMMGIVIGALAAILGIGGGTLLVPALTGFGLGMHIAVGTSSALGAVIAAPGALGYIVSGWHELGRPAFSLGYISIPAFLVLAPTAALAAPYGVRLSHRLPVLWLRRSFAVFLMLVASRMLMKSFS